MHRTYVFIFCFDFLFSTLVILNLVVFVWRIIWDTQDIYLQSNLYLNSVVSILVSLFILLLVKIRQMRNARNFSMTDDAENGSTAKKPSRTSKRRRQEYGAKLKLFILIFSFANINLWRGIWNFTFKYTEESTVGIFMIGLISLLALCAMNRVCALVSVPFLYAKDDFDSAYQINPNTNQTRVCLKIEQELKIKPTKWSFFIHFLQEFLADIFTIESWRSLWCLYDVYVYPNDRVTSAYLSLAQGLVCYFLLHFFNKSINAFILKKTMAEINRSLDECSLHNHLDDGHSIAAVSRLLSEHKIDMTTCGVGNEDDDDDNHPELSHHKKPCCSPAHKIDECLNFDRYVRSSGTAGSVIHERDLHENFEKTGLSLFNRAFLYFVFMIGFVGTVNLWRGLWELQYAYCYPASVNKNLLNLVYMPCAIFILWMLNLTSSLLSRASCQDDYFIAKKNYIVKHNIFRVFFLKKVRGKKGGYDFRFKSILRKILFLKSVKAGETIVKDFKGERLIYQPKEMVIKMSENAV